ncbi:Uncharacterised protein [Mannheimia haemolytica]|nr:Uncharacterised protein [Mannheimia haemolytica]
MPKKLHNIYYTEEALIELVNLPVMQVVELGY